MYCLISKKRYLQEQPRPEYEALALETRLNPITKVEEPFISIGKKVPRFVCGISFIVFMVSLSMLLFTWYSANVLEETI